MFDECIKASLSSISTWNTQPTRHMGDPMRRKCRLTSGVMSVITQPTAALCVTVLLTFFVVWNEIRGAPDSRSVIIGDEPRIQIASVRSSFPIHEFVRVKRLQCEVSGPSVTKADASICAKWHICNSSITPSLYHKAEKRLIVFLQSLCRRHPPPPRNMSAEQGGKQGKLCPSKLPLGSATAHSLLPGRPWRTHES